MIQRFQSFRGGTINKIRAKGCQSMDGRGYLLARTLRCEEGADCHDRESKLGQQRRITPDNEQLVLNPGLVLQNEVRPVKSRYRYDHKRI